MQLQTLTAAVVVRASARCQAVLAALALMLRLTLCCAGGAGLPAGWYMLLECAGCCVPAADDDKPSSWWCAARADASSCS